MRKFTTLLIAGLLISSSSLWAQTTSITISGQSQWESTGVTITPEMAVTIEATGEWCGAPWSCYGPEGTGGIAPSIFLAPGLSSGGLVGKVGNNSPFLVGSMCSFDGQDHGTGTLYLAFNDEITGYYNNSGTLDVTITTTEEGGIELVGQYTDKAASDLKIRGDFAYVTDLSAKQLYILNITDPMTPTLVGSYTSPHSEATMVSLIDQYAYVTVGWSGFEVIDISNPALPTKVGPTHDTPGYTKDIEFANGHAFVAARESGVRVYNVSDPANPSYVTTYSTSAWATSMVVSGNYLYVGIEHSPNGIDVFDISNPPTQNRVGSLSFTNSVIGIAKQGSYVYHSGQWECTFNVVDVADPFSPVRVGDGFQTHGDPWGIAVSGDLAFLGERSYGLQVLDISDKTNPTLLDEYDTGGDPLWGIAVVGDYVYLADGPGGVKILSTTGSPPPPESADILVYATSETTYGFYASSFDEDLPAILAEDGLTVTVTDRMETPEITVELLNGYDQLWIMSTDPYSGSGCFSNDEISAILDFRNAGKGLLIAADDGPPVHDYTGDANQISTQLGVTFSGEYNYGPYAQPFEPDFSAHPLFSGVQNIVCTENAAILGVNSPSEVVATYQGTNMIAALDDGSGRAVFDVSMMRFWDEDERSGYIPYITVGNTPQYVKNIASWLGGGGQQPAEITFTIHDSEGPSPGALVRALVQPPGSDVVNDYNGYTNALGWITFPIEQGSAVILSAQPEDHWSEWQSFDHITNQNVDVHATVQLPSGQGYKVQNLELPYAEGIINALISACIIPPLPPGYEELKFVIPPRLGEDEEAWFANKAIALFGKHFINYAMDLSFKNPCYENVGKPVVKIVSAFGPSKATASSIFSSGIHALLNVPTSILYSAMAWTDGITSIMPGGGSMGMQDGQGGYSKCDIDLLIIDGNGNRAGSVYSEAGEFLFDINEITGAYYSGHGTHPNTFYAPLNVQIEKLMIYPRSTGPYSLGFSVLDSGSFRSYQLEGMFDDLSPIDVSLHGFNLNNGPVAIAGNDTSIESGHGIILDGSQSYDIDGQIVSFVWSEGSQVLSTNATCSTIFPPGIHQLTLTVMDNDSITAVTQQTVIVGSGESGSGFLSVGVIDTLTGREVDGASMVYDGPDSGSVTASPLGTILLSLIPGDYNMVLSHPEYYPDTLHFDISAGQTNVEQVSLAPRFGMIEGLVRDTIAHMNLNGAVISYSGPESGQVLSDSSGSYAVAYLTPGAYLLECDKDCYLRLADSVTVAEGQSSILAFESYQIGSLSGSVFDSTMGLSGISVDIVDSHGELYDMRVTDDSGHYQIDGIPNGDYSIMLVTPLGYQTVAETKEVTIACDPLACDFVLSQLEIAPQQRSRAYWAHQLHKALQYKPQDYTIEDFSDFASLINIHFNQNQVNPVDFYSVPQPASQTDSLRVLKQLLHMRNTGDWEPYLKRLAKSQLMALMLNVVSGKVSQTHEISADVRTVSQLITYCDMLVGDEIDPPDSNGCPGYGSPWFRYIYASFMLVKANLGLTAPAGMIPEDVVQIAYKQHNEDNLPTEFALHQNYPNPFNPTTEISFALPNAADVKLEIFNIMGQQVATLADRRFGAGNHTIEWNGSQVASGVYFYRLEADDFVESKKMVLLK